MAGPWAAAAAFIWGMASIALSPCTLVLLPMIMGFVAGEGEISRKRTLALSGAFSSGVFVNLLVVSLPFLLGGAILKPLLGVLHWISFALLLAFGLALLDLYELPALSSGAVRASGHGVKGALLMGLMSGLITGPCALAFVAPVLTLALMNAAEGHLAGAVLLVLSFALGYAFLLCLAGMFSNRLQGILQRSTKAGFVLKQICGWLVILAAAFVLYQA